MELKLHPEVKEALKRLCEDPKTTIVVLSGCLHFVLKKVISFSIVCQCSLYQFRVSITSLAYKLGSPTTSHPSASYNFLDTNDNPLPISIRLLTTPNSPSEPNTTTLESHHTPPATEPNITNNSHHSHTNNNSPTVNTPTESTPHPSDLMPHSQPPTAQSQHTRPNPTTSQQQPVQNTSQKHLMVTRSKVGIVKSNPKFSMHVSTTSPVPCSHIHALHDPNWKHAMLDEYNALITNDGFLAATKHALSPMVVVNNKTKYATEVLKRAHMLNCNPCKTPVDTDTKLGTHGSPVEDPSFYRSLAVALQYLTFTRPDLSYALVAYSDADWAGCPTTRRSTSGYCVFLGDNLLTWSSKRQHVTSRSSAEAEYRGVANAVAETAWVRNLLRELHSPLCTATLVYCDNISAVYLSSNPVQYQRTKHIEIDLHFVRDFFATGHVHVLHVPTKYQYADIFTKGLPSPLFTEFWSSLSVRPSAASTARAYYPTTSHPSVSYNFLDTDDNPYPISIRLLTTPNSPSEPNITTLESNHTPHATKPNITNNSHHSHTNNNSPTVNTPTESTPHPSDLMPHSQPPTAQPQHTRPNPTTSQQQPVQNTSKQHPMVTRSKVGIVKSNPKFSMHVSTTSPVPRSHIHALHDPNWKHAMLDEYNALIINDGSFSRYKARLVANGRSQQQGIDCDETFSPVVKPATIRTVLSLAVSRAWPIHQLDVKNKIISSLHGEFSMIDLGPLNYFLGITAHRTSSGLFLSQTKYATEVLKRAHMLNCNPCKTPVDTDTKLGTHGSPIEDPSFYRSLAGALHYMHLPRLSLWRILMQSGQGARLLGARLLAIVSFSATTYLHGLPRDNMSPLALVQRQNIAVSLMQSPRLLGFGIF
nr:ribonuclease H-like domain-containing protein [Tanacetum cinerariifolium]